MRKYESILHEQSVVNAREATAEIRRDLTQLGTEFDKTLNQSQDLQQLVFRNLPYELVENALEL